MGPLLETREKHTIDWRVYSDTESLKILQSNPHYLLQEMFTGDPQRVFLLEKTGFKMPMQIQTWINLYNTAIENNTDLNKVTTQLISKTIQDVIGFYFEYLTKQDIFPISVEFKELEDGKKTVYASKYHQTLESLALPAERDGALAEGVKQAVEILINSGPGTIVFLTSPTGRSGLGHDHPDSQTYVYWIKSDGNLDALTIRTDINLVASEKLIGIESSYETSTWDRLKNVVRSPKSVNENSFEAILDLIEEASGQTFEKQREEINNREKLFTLNESASLIITNLKNYLTNHISDLNLESIKLFVVEVGKAILDLSILTLGQQQKPSVVYANSGYLHNRPATDSYTTYRAQLEAVQKRRGCNGGGDSQTAVSFGMEQAQMAMTQNRCQKCGTTEGVVCGWCKPCWNIFGK